MEHTDNTAPTTGILSNTYFTPAQWAVELGTSIRTLDRWELRRIGPPCTRIGRKSFYRRDAVIAWLREREAPVHPQNKWRGGR
jgi:phage terminase Nu1 subunit (DNA packaging protein)